MVVDIFLKWWLQSGRYTWSRIYRRLFEARYLKYELPPVDSLENIKAMLDQIRWTPDTILGLFDSVSYPEATWVRKQDDCDGFSCLAAALIHSWRPEYKPALLTVMVRPVKNSHTVCVFQEAQNKYRFFDNSVLRTESYGTWQQVAMAIKKNNDRLVCWDVTDPFRLETIEFH